MRIAKRDSNATEPEAKERLQGDPQPASTRDPVSAVPGWPFGFFGEWKAVVASILLFALVLWAFFPAIRAGFSGYDDDLYVTANSQVQRGLTWEGVGWAFRSTAAGNWHPLTWLSHMLDWQLFGRQSWGHHLTSILFHAVNSLLLFVVLKRMTGAFWRSLLVAALFGLHPLRVESVAWIAERKDVLSTMFWLLTLWVYARFAEETKAQRPRSKLFYGLALTFLALGLMCKSMLVTVPFLLLALDYWPLSRWKHKNVWGLVAEKVPFFAVAAAASAVALAAQQNAGAVAAASLPFADRAENALVSYVRYLGKLFWPANLSVFYPHPGHWPIQFVLLSSLLLFIISLMVFALRRRCPYLLTGWLWFIGTLVPVIGLVQVGSQSLADRYTYVPSIGVLVLLVWGAQELAARWRCRTISLSAAAAVAIVFCLAFTRQQVGFWKDDETLFRHAIGVTRGNYVAMTNLGTALLRKGRIDEAVVEFRHALTAKPDFVNARCNLGVALFRQGRWDEAIAELRRAINERPDYAAAQDSLGVVLNEAIRLQPDSADLHYNLGNAFLKAGRLDEGISQLEEAIRLQPASADMHNNLGVALVRKGRLDEAIRQFQAVLGLQPDNPEARANLAAALRMKEADSSKSGASNKL